SEAAHDTVIAVLGLAGDWVGAGCVICSPGLARCICTRMLQDPNETAEVQILDTVAELANIIIGCVKTDLEPELGPLTLTTPTVVLGRNFNARNTGATDGVVLRFCWAGECMHVMMSISPLHKSIDLGRFSPAESVTGERGVL